MELSFTFRGRNFPVSIGRDSTLKELGEQLQSLTGASPETIKLLLPHGVALMPFSVENMSRRIGDCDFKEGRTIRMMGASSQELVQVSEASRKERVIGFEEEETRARQRAAPGFGGLKLPQGPYVFGGFKTLELPGVQMTPPPSKALELMHTLASDPGIVAIMNKHRWGVGIMTEMAPEGLVGISSMCILGLNKNHGEEISLRLRTDDLRGFRKYESIKKTLLHELAHMVFGEHDDDFYRLDRQLNKEALELDWTRSQKQTLSNSKHRFEQDSEPEEAPTQAPNTGYRLGGASSTSRSVNIKLAAANAAITRSERRNVENELDNDPKVEPDPDDEVMKVEPDPDDKVMKVEPDPDDKEMKVEPDPDDKEMKVEPDPDDKEMKVEPDDSEPDKVMKVEPDPDDSENENEGFEEPDPDDQMMEPDPDDDDRRVEPDPDDKETRATLGDQVKNANRKVVNLEPDPDDTMVLDSRTDESSGGKNGVDLPVDDEELGRIQDAAAAVNMRLQQLIAKLKLEATPPEALTAFQTLVKILSNVMEHPNEEKYKLLKKSNPVFQQRVARFEGAVDLLKMVGFIEEAKERFVLRNNDPGLLWLARSSLEAFA